MTGVLIAAPPCSSESLSFFEGALNLLVVGTTFAPFLIPVTVLLFFFTPVRIWRSRLFIFNVISIILGLALQVLYTYVIFSTILFRPIPAALVTAIVALNFLIPTSVQGILLIRLLGVYPLRAKTRGQNLAIYVPVVAFTIARVINAAYATRDIIGHLSGSIGIIRAAQLVWGTKYIKVEWFLQLFDDTLVSSLFLHKLYAIQAHVQDTHGASASGRPLYYIAVSNFVFPIIFNIAEIAVIFYDPDVFHGAVVVTANCYVAIIVVLVATIWVQGSRGQRCDSRPRCTTTVIELASLEFVPRDGVV